MQHTKICRLLSTTLQAGKYACKLKHTVYPESDPSRSSLITLSWEFDKEYDDTCMLEVSADYTIV